MAKVHLVQTKNPLSEGESATSMCGTVIFKAAIGTMCDSSVFPGVEVDSLLRDACVKCQNSRLSNLWRERYLYFVTEASEEDEYESVVVDGVFYGYVNKKAKEELLKDPTADGVIDILKKHS